MKPLFSFLFSILCLTGFTQDFPRNDTTPEFHKLSLEISFTPALSYRILSAGDNNPPISTIIQSRNEREIPYFGYSAGIHFGIRVKRWLGIETGMSYTGVGYQTEEMEAGSPPVPDPAVPDRVKYIYRIRYLDIPLKVNFEPGKKKLRFSAFAGIIPAIRLEYFQKQVAHYNNGTTQISKSPIAASSNPVNIFVTAGAGIHYHFSRRVSLKIVPDFRFGVIKTVDAPIEELVWYAGIHTAFCVGL